MTLLEILTFTTLALYLGNDIPSIGLSSDHELPVHGDTFHVQGVSVSEAEIWITSVDRETKSGWIYCFNRLDGRLVKKQNIEVGSQYHPGGFQQSSDLLWVPVAEYRPMSTSTLLAIDRNSLQVVQSIPIDDHIGALAVDGEGNLYAGNWDCRKIYVIDPKGTVLRTIPNRPGVPYQDLEWHEGELMGTGYDKRNKVAVVDVIDPKDGQHCRRYLLEGKPKHGSNYSREGFSKFGDHFFLMPEDGPHTTVYRFPIRNLPEEP